MLKLLRKILILSCLTVISLFALAYWGMGYTPQYLYNAPSVATGIGAKLACSARFVSGYDARTSAADIRVYSPILALLDYQYDDALQRVSATLLGVKSRSASYQPGIGCAPSTALASDAGCAGRLAERQRRGQLRPGDSGATR
jgi:hypothetical protein